jgi:hypothetical protein
LGLNLHRRENRIRLSANNVFKKEAQPSLSNDALLVQFQLFLR